MHQFPHLLRGSHPLELASWTSAPGLHHVLGPDVELEVCVCACAVCAEMKVARGPEHIQGGAQEVAGFCGKNGCCCSPLPLRTRRARAPSTDESQVCEGGGAKLAVRLEAQHEG